MKIISDDEAEEYLNTVVRKQISSQNANLGKALLLETPFGNTMVKDKFGIGHHSDKEKVVHAWAWSFEGLPEPIAERKRWLIDTGETLEATQSEAITKISKDNPDFDASTEVDKQVIRDFLGDSKD